MDKSVINPNHLQISYLLIRLLAKICLLPPNQYSRCFRGHLQTYTDWWKISITLHTCTQLRSNKEIVNKGPSLSLFSATFFTYSVLFVSDLTV